MSKSVDAGLRATARRPAFAGVSTRPWTAPTLADFGIEDWSKASAEERGKVVASTLLGTNEDGFDLASAVPVVEPGTGRLNAEALRAAMAEKPEGAPEPTVQSAHEMARELLDEHFGDDPIDSAKGRFVAQVMGDVFRRLFRRAPQGEENGPSAQEGLEDDMGANAGGDAAKTKPLVDRIVASGRFGEDDAAWLGALGEDQLGKIAASCCGSTSADGSGSSEVQRAAAAKTATVDKIVAAGVFTDRAWLDAQEPARLEQLLTASTAAKPAEPKTLTEAEWWAQAPAPVRQKFDEIKALEDAESAKLRGEIIAASEFTEDELKGKPLEELRKLHGLARADYSGRGIRAAERKRDTGVSPMPGMKIGSKVA